MSTSVVTGVKAWCGQSLSEPKTNEEERGCNRELNEERAKSERACGKLHVNFEL
jgi:hypothetical protein